MHNRTEKLVDFTALCLWLITSATMAVIAYLEHGQDFRGYYAAGRVLLGGGNPYEYARVADMLLAVTGKAGNNPFYYPLWFGWIVAPLSLLPFQAARAVWMFFNLVLWLFGLLRLRQLLDFPPRGWRSWLMNLLATFIFAWTTWKFEQTGILLFVIVVEALTAYQKQQWGRMGLFLALALIKPNVMLLPVAVLIGWFIRNRNWRPVFIALAVLLALVIVTTALTPTWHQPFLQPGFGRGLTDVLDGPDQVTGVRINTTMLDWLKSLEISSLIGTVIYSAAIFIGVALIVIQICQTRSLMQTAIVSLLVSYAITPYALQYDYPPLAIVLYWATARSIHLANKAVPVLLLSFMASVLIWERPISDGYWIVIGLIALTAWVTWIERNLAVPEKSFNHPP